MSWVRDFFGLMSDADVQKHNDSMMDQARLSNADVIEWDEDVIVGFGSDADYDTHASDVQNGYGYYDDKGHYICTRYNYE